MNDLFEKEALPWIDEVEGHKLTNDPNDRGGATKYGISLRYLKNVPDHDGDGFLDGDLDHDGDVDEDDIRLLTPAHRAERYENDFWLAAKCNEMPRHVALCLLDCMIQHKPKTAKMLIQRGLGVKADGIIGTKETIPAAMKSNPLQFVQEHLSYRAQFYHDIVVSNSTQAEWLRGWLRRCFLLEQYILTGRLS